MFSAARCVWRGARGCAAAAGKGLAVGFRFRKSFKVAPGVRVNLSKSGIGTSFGVRGARYSVGPREYSLDHYYPGLRLPPY